MTSQSEPETGINLALKDSQQREAASLEILEVLNRSRSDEKPVFDTILKNAARLCRAPLAYLALVNESRTALDMAAYHGTGADFVEALKRSPIPLDPSQADTARAVLEKRVIQVEDLTEGRLYKDRQPHRVHAVETEGVRTLLLVPLISDDEGIGAICLYRREVRPFAESDVKVVRAFAEKAVIAINNVKQFKELEIRLECGAAISEILQIINRSRNDYRPVFDTMLEKATALCQAPFAFLLLVNSAKTHLEIVASRGTRPEFVELLTANALTVDPTQSATARSLHEKSVIHIDDLSADRHYLDRQPHRVHAVEVEGIRTFLAVPLISGEQSLGVITLYRREVHPFRGSHIDLVKTFAEQAVIAIENVRQFKELDARTEEVQVLNTELESRVESQVSELERMGRLKRFLSPAVAETVVSSGNDKLLSSHRALIAVMFCDIRGFTAFCETAEPEETIEVLQTYHEAMGRLINDHRAGVDHRSGDGIMVIFNDPLPCDDPGNSALKLAIAMRDEMAVLCEDWRKLGYRLGFGIGISLGYATVGVVGSAGRYEYTASGTAVNTAARLCDEAGDGEILLSPRAYRAVEDSVDVEPAGQFTLKGIQAPVEVVRLIGQRDVETSPNVT